MEKVVGSEWPIQMLTNENEILTVGKSLCISFWLGIRVEFVFMSSALDLGNPNFQIDNYIYLSFFPLLSVCACTGYTQNGDNNPMNKVRLKKIMLCLWSIEVCFLYDS